MRDLATPAMQEGLLTANEKIYNAITLGITVTEFIVGKKHAATIPIIDWDTPENNRFLVTEEFEVLSTNGTRTRPPGYCGLCQRSAAGGDRGKTPG